MTFSRILRLVIYTSSLLLASSCHSPLGEGITTVFEHRDCQSLSVLYPDKNREGRVVLRLFTDGELLAADSEMESQILTFHHRKATDTGSALDLIIYHTIVCADFRIEASLPFLGVPSGENLSDYFLVDERSPGYIFGPDKKLIGTIAGCSLESGELTLPGLIAQKPMMLHQLYLKTKSIADLPSGIVFSVTVRFEGGRVLTASSDAL